MITDQKIAQACSDLKSTCGGTKEDYFGLLYLEDEHKVPRESAVNQVAFGGHDYAFDGFHFDEKRRNLYLYQFKYSQAHGQFKTSLQRLIEDGMERLFSAPTKDDTKNQVLLQLRSCLLNNKALIDQVFFRFVFTGDPEEAERSPVLNKLREDLENKKYFIDQFFGAREVGFVVEFRSTSGRIGGQRESQPVAKFTVLLENLVDTAGPNGERMHIGFLRLSDLHGMYAALGPRFLDNNIRYGFGEGEAVNRAISSALKKIVIDKSEDPCVFAFHHNGITLYAEQFDAVDHQCTIVAPRLLNGAQTVTTLAGFLAKNKDNPKLLEGKQRLDSTRLLCKVITMADQNFVTQVTINNNRQNPVEPWNLHANDLIQLELQEKFRDDLKIYYERQENAFDQLAPEDLEEYGIREQSRAIHMLKLAQTFLLTDGSISRLSDMRRVFEDENVYRQVFRNARLKADSRHVLLCYKVQFNLRRYADEIQQKGQSKYWFISRSRQLLWALLCQGLLNHDKLEQLSEKHGNSMAIAVGLKDTLMWLATARVRPLLADLMKDKEYEERVVAENLGFLRTDKAFEKCMALAYKKWHWTHKKLGVMAAGPSVQVH
jgi:hypothetical protein